MNKQLAMLWTITASVGLLLVGCQKSTEPSDEVPPAGVTDEVSSMKYQAGEDEFVKNDELSFSDADVLPTDYGYLGKVDAAITPLRWGRIVRNVTRTITIEVQPGDTTAIAHVHKNIVGVLKIRGINGAGDTILVEKPFNDESDRNVLFKRIDRNARKFWRNWIPVATSLVEGGTVRNPQINITQVQLVKSNGDTITINNPQRYYLRYRWLRHRNGDADMPELTGGDSVKVKVTLESASRDTDLVALRFGMNSQFKNRARMFLTGQRPGGTLGFIKVFERTFYVHNRPGHFHAAVDAATRATLYDDDVTKYSVSWWGVPYRVF